MAKKEWNNTDWDKNIISTGFVGDWPAVRISSPIRADAEVRAVAALPARKEVSLFDDDQEE